MQILCSLRDQLVQMSTTRSSFDQYCISHKTISHPAAVAPSPEVRRECPMAKFIALPLLATNPGDATVVSGVLRSGALLQNWFGSYPVFFPPIPPFPTLSVSLRNRQILGVLFSVYGCHIREF